jgi:multiple sugar transport system substrate-binding protein
MAIALRGMTWSHPRGYDPMVAASLVWKAKTGVDIAWDKRSLQDFESYPVEELAARYDLIVIDHPHVGQITRENCLLPLDAPGREAARDAIAAGSVGPSYPSYAWRGAQWAFPIDAATQVQAYRPDRLGEPVRSWADAMALARAGRVAIPMRPPHSLMTFYTLAAHAGSPCHTEAAPLIERAAGAAVIERLREFAACVDPACLTMDPIDVFERLAPADSPIDCAPLIYGYVPYARDGFRARRIAFADMPVDEGRPPVGSALGGTGVAVSARTAHPEAALDFAHFVASGEVQRGLYARAGGQPGHAAAWEDEAVNRDAHDFYRATRATLEGAWVRPRHAGYMPFQHAASAAINEALANGSPAGAVVDQLNRLFEQSFRG